MKKIILAIAISLALATEVSAMSYWYASNGEFSWGPFAQYRACQDYLYTLRSQGFYGVNCIYR